MIITLTGQNTYAIRQALDSLVLEFAQKHGPHSVERVDAEAFEPRNLFELLQGTSLFAAERLVVLKDASKNKPLWEALATIEQPSATVIIAEPSIDKRSRTYKMLKQNSDFREFGVPTDTEFIAWVGSSVKTLGGTISSADARFLIERTGRNQWQLSQEVEKLVSFSPQVTRKSIIELVEQTPEGNAFQLLDAALGGNVSLVVALADQLKTQEDPYKMFGLVASQVHTLAVVATAGSHSPDKVAQEAGLHPFVVRKIASIAKRLGKERIRHIASHVAKCDEQLKTTGAEPWDLLKLCLQKLATQ